MSFKYLPLFLSVLIAPNLANADVPIEAGIVDVFNALKIYAWTIIIILAFIGAGVYAYRRKRMLSTKWIGFLVPLSSFIIFWAVSMLVMNNTTKVCWDITNISDPLMPPCAQGRETLANIIGGKSLWTTVFPQQILEQGMAEPMAPIAIKLILFISLLVVTFLLYFLSKVIVEKFFIHR